MTRKRNYQKEDKYEAEPIQVKRREARNTARRHAVAKGLVSKGDGLDIDHIKPLSKRGSFDDSNTRVRKRSANRSFARTSQAKMK
jgi:hypothetical protein